MKKKWLPLVPALMIIVVVMWAAGLSSPRSMGQKITFAVFKCAGCLLSGIEACIEVCERIPVDMKHIPDMKIYDTDILRYRNFTVYRHSVHFGEGFFHNGGVVNTKFTHVPPYMFVNRFLANRFQFEQNCGLAGKETMGDFTLEKYNVRGETARYDREQHMGRNGQVYDLQALYYGGELVWVSADCCVVGAEKTDRGYTVITDEGVCWVTGEHGRLVGDYYIKANNIFDVRTDIKSGKMVADNVARIEYEDGTVAHWKIRLTFLDCVKNLRANKNLRCSGSVKAKASMIWRSRWFEGKTPALGWDFDYDTSAEPEYK